MRIHGAMPDRRARGIRAKIVAASPVLLRPDRSRTKTSAAIGANIPKTRVDAATTESAFKRADHRLSGIRRKCDVAVLASRS